MAELTQLTLGAKQALNDDYAGSGYTRGHLNPNCYNCDEAKQATFTLTNIAPQTDYDNGKAWKMVETELKNKLNQECNLKKYPNIHMVTGVIPGQTFLTRQVGDKEENRVNIPRYYWTAFSCVKKDEDTCMSGGYLLEMKRKTNAEMDKSKEAAFTPTYYDNVEELNEALTEHYLQPFKVFGQRKGAFARCFDWFKSWLTS